MSLPAADIARIHCHGGLAACESIVRSLESQGATRVAWQELADPWRTALAGALTERTALHLLDQSPAAWQNKINEWLTMLTEASRVPEVIRQLDELLARAPLGLHLTEPWRVVIAGRPNAGKSSLLNALLGFQRSIIHHEPGTTRDVVTARTAFDGWPVELRDTAGLRDTQDELEAAGVERAEEEIRNADLVLYIIPADAPAAESEAEKAAAEKLQALGSQVVEVRSKCDLRAAPTAANICSVSAITAEGMSHLIDMIVERLVPNPPPDRTLLPFNHDLAARLKQVRAELLAGKLAAARSELQSLLQLVENVALSK